MILILIIKSVKKKYQKNGLSHNNWENHLLSACYKSLFRSVCVCVPYIFMTLCSETSLYFWLNWLLKVFSYALHLNEKFFFKSVRVKLTRNESTSLNSMDISAVFHNISDFDLLLHITNSQPEYCCMINERCEYKKVT